MKPRINFITIAVDDLQKSAAFYKVGEIKDEPWGYSANFTDPDGHQWEII